QGFCGHWVMELAGTLPLASAAPSCTGTGLLGAPPGGICTGVSAVAKKVTEPSLVWKVSFLGMVKLAPLGRSVVNTTTPVAGVAGTSLVPVGLAWNCWFASEVATAVTTWSGWFWLLGSVLPWTV